MRQYISISVGGFSLFDGNLFLGDRLDKKGYDASIHLLNVSGFLVLDDGTRLGLGISFLTVGYAAKYDNGKYVIRSGFGYFTIEIIIDLEN